MATDLTITVNDSHLHQAVSSAFDFSSQSIDDVSVALKDYKRRATCGQQRRFLERLHDRYVTVQGYLAQIQQDYEQGLTNPRHNVKTFVEVVKDSAYNQGHKDGAVKAAVSAHRQGYDEGFDDGFESDYNPWAYAAIGFAVAALPALLIRFSSSRK